ncbi:hypothetical protein NM688_g3561 [Phlebia brevispora]|uniref:Uncharacterized protein n=1 Tax=Phlebia brevispora TaxID=194682 RepID=A0ACC1T5C0_9APHY|nr:hypothetical protein NM688_g3561 [Phlebia brevispora]
MAFNLKLFLFRIYGILARYVITFTSKRSLARLLSTCLCCIVVVIRPFSALGGSYAFLVLALKELVFSVQASLAQQLELTVLNILGAFLGIAVSTLAKFIASRTPEDSANARATCAVFLILISFFAGLAKSRLPRLQLSTRISCFASVWILTNDIGNPSRVLNASGNFLWITLCAAILCLVALLIVMALIRWASTNFERDIASTMSVIHTSLDMGLNLAFPTPQFPTIDQIEYQRLRHDLLQRSIKLNENYSQAAFELRIGRLSLRSIRPLIATVEHMRRELAWGMPLRRPECRSRRGTVHNGQTTPILPPRNEYTVELEPSARALGTALLEATNCVEKTIVLAFHQGPLPAQLFSWTVPSTSGEGDKTEGEAQYHHWTVSQINAIREAEAHLKVAKDEARDELKRVFNDVDEQQRDEDADPNIPQDALHCSLAMIALLQMAQEARTALQVAQRFATQYEESHPRLWYPRFSLSWLGVPPGSFVYDDPNMPLDKWGSSSDETLTLPDSDYASPEWKQGLREIHSVHVRRAALRAARMHMLAKDDHIDADHTPSWWTAISNWCYEAWANPRSMRLRMRLWKFLKAVRHSSHLRHALKNASGVALLTFPAFMPADSNARKWYTKVHGQWMTISFLWVFETNTGATWRTGYLRILGTVFGAIYAYITWLICHTNPYGLTTMVTAADIPITWLIMQNNLSPLAVPMSVAIPPIVFAKYISPDTTGSIIDLALLRAAMISAGMVAALLMNSLIFPRHARVYFLSDTSRTLGLLTDLYLTLSHDIWQDRTSYTKDERQKTLKLELHIRNALHRLSALIATMNNEIGLLPKPLHHYRRIVTVLQNLLDLLSGLRKIRENIPRKMTVADVFKERREFMSCVCIVLFACQHAFKAREPLPQFLPSARHALMTLETSLQERIRQARREEPCAMGLSLVYSFAELGRLEKHG